MTRLVFWIKLWAWQFCISVSMLELGFCKQNDVVIKWKYWKMLLYVFWWNCASVGNFAVRCPICDAYIYVCDAYWGFESLSCFGDRFATHTYCMRRMVWDFKPCATHTYMYAAHIYKKKKKILIRFWVESFQVGIRAMV